MHLFYQKKRNLTNGEMFEAGFTSLLTMEGCSFGCQVLRCSLQAPCVTHGEKYAILGYDSLTYFRSCEAGQGKARANLSLLGSELLLRAVSLYPVDVSGLDLAAHVEMADAT